MTMRSHLHVLHPEYGFTFDPRGWIHCYDFKREEVIGQCYMFSQRIERTLGVTLSPVLRDLARVAAAVYIADRLSPKPRHGNKGEPTTIKRGIKILIPVVESDRWNSPSVVHTLQDSLSFLTRD